jgi:hypothetical protein
MRHEFIRSVIVHVFEAIFRPKDGDIERTADWWKGLMESSTAFEKNGMALNRMDGENSVLIVRHLFDDLADEQKAWEAWGGSDTGNRARASGMITSMGRSQPIDIMSCTRTKKIAPVRGN